MSAIGQVSWPPRTRPAGGACRSCCSTSDNAASAKVPSPRKAGGGNPAVAQRRQIGSRRPTPRRRSGDAPEPFSFERSLTSTHQVVVPLELLDRMATLLQRIQMCYTVLCTPAQTGHSFRWKADSDSSVIRTPIPVENGQFFRSSGIESA